MPSRALLVANPRASRTGPAVVGTVVARLVAAGWAVEAHEARDPGTVRRLAAEGAAAGVDLVVAIGGDGTLVEAMTPLVGSGIPLGIVPGGAGNLLATNLGIPGRAAAAADVLVTGRPRRLDLGRADWSGGSRYFSIAVGVGFDARVIAATGVERKRRLGKLAYFATAAGLATLLEAVPHAVTIDGERRELGASEVLVANVGEVVPGLLGPRWPVIPDDGLLDVLVMTARDPFNGLLGAWEALFQPGPGDHPGGRVFRARAREVRVEATPAQPVELDGDPLGTTPVSATVVPGAISVIVPAR